MNYRLYVYGKRRLFEYFTWMTFVLSVLKNIKKYQILYKDSIFNPIDFDLDFMQKAYSRKVYRLMLSLTPEDFRKV